MNIVKTEKDRIKILDPKTGGIKLNLPVGGETAGTAIIQGDSVIVPVRDGQNIRTKVYDVRTGNLKVNIP
jgi:hypothetical protein